MITEQKKQNLDKERKGDLFQTKNEFYNNIFINYHILINLYIKMSIKGKLFLS